MPGIERTYEYELVHRFYDGKIAQRSKVYKIYHVIEGCFILDRLGADLATKRAFCLHPMLQDDVELAENFRTVAVDCDPVSVMLALEYRNIANGYLSNRNIESIGEITLSPLTEINVMLRADKIQNRKDFDLYLKGKIKNSDRMVQYFKNWHERLEISEEEHCGYVSELMSAFPNTR